MPTRLVVIIAMKLKFYYRVYAPSTQNVTGDNLDDDHYLYIVYLLTVMNMAVSNEGSCIQ